MKTKARLRLTLATALFAAAVTTHAQTWETILQLDSAVQGVGKVAGGNRAMMIDPASATAPFPSLLVTGKTLDDSVNGIPERLHRLEQAAAPNAGTLVPLDPNSGFIFSMAADANGWIYWAGDDSTSGSATAWRVRRSTDGGATWSTIRSLSLGGAFAQARGMTVDSAGNLIVCGVAFDSRGYSHWIVETSADGGAHWLTQDVFKSLAVSSLTTGEALVQAMGVADLPGPNGGLFVAGSLGNRNGFAGRWTVTRSRDGGQTWQTVDSWLPSSKSSSRARKVAVDAAGRIFVMGDSGAGHEMDPSPWVVRMSVDGGDTWNTIFGPWDNGINPVPLDMTIDANNNVWIAGHVLQRYPTSKRNSYTYYTTAMVVRLHETTPGVWSSSAYPVSPECLNPNSARVGSITADTLGRVYVNGFSRENSTSPIQWFVQRWVP